MVDAVACLSGDGLTRVLPAVAIARAEGCHLVLAGSRDAPPEAYHWLDVLPHTTTLPAARVVCVDALNTWEQAVNVVAVARTRGWTRLAIVASGWHAGRAWLTFVKALGGQYDLRITVFRVASPHMDSEAFRQEEDAKIVAYRQLGHVATDQEAAAYLLWLGAAA